MPTMQRNPMGGVINTTGMGRGAGVVRPPMPTQAFRRGGRVRGYQEGGEVDDDDQQPYQVAQATPDTMRGGGNIDVIQDAVTRTLNPPVQEMYERLNPPKGSGSAYQDVLNYQSMRNPRVRAAMDEGSQMPEDPGIRARRPPPVQQALRPGQAGAASLQEDSPVVPTLSDRLHGAMSAPFRRRRELGYQEGGYVDDEGLEDQGVDDAMVDPMAMVTSAMNFGKKKYGLPTDDQGEMGFEDGGVVPTQEEAAQGNPNAIDPRQAMAYLAGDGAVSQEIAQALEQRVDPQGQLNPTQRAVAAIGVAPNDEAKFGLIQHYRTKYNGYAAATKAAMQRGDMGEAAHQASLAMDSVPNGKRTQFAPAPGGLAMIERPAFRQGGGKSAPPQQQAFDDGGVVEDDDDEEVLSRMQPQPQADPPDVLADVPDVEVPAQVPITSPQPEVMPMQSIIRLLDDGFDAKLEPQPKMQGAYWPPKGSRGYPIGEAGRDQAQPFAIPGSGADQAWRSGGDDEEVVPITAPDTRTFEEKIKAAPQATLGGVATEIGNLAGAAKGVIQRAAPAGSLVRYALGEPYPEEYQAARAVPEKAAAAPATAPVTAPVTSQGQEQRFRPAPAAEPPAAAAPPAGAVIDDERWDPVNRKMRPAVPGTFGTREAARRAGTEVPLTPEAAGASVEGPVPRATRGGAGVVPTINGRPVSAPEREKFDQYLQDINRLSGQRNGGAGTAGRDAYLARELSGPVMPSNPRVVPRRVPSAQEAALAAHERARGIPNNFGNSTGTLNIGTSSNPRDYLQRGGRPANAEEQRYEQAQRAAAAAYPAVGADAAKRQAEIAAILKRQDEYDKAIGVADVKATTAEQIAANRISGAADLEDRKAVNRSALQTQKDIAALTRKQSGQEAAMNLAMAKGKLAAASAADIEGMKVLSGMMRNDPSLQANPGKLLNLAGPLMASMKLKPEELMYAVNALAAGGGATAPAAAPPSSGTGTSYLENMVPGDGAPRNYRGKAYNFYLSPDGREMVREDLYEKRFGKKPNG